MTTPIIPPVDPGQVDSATAELLNRIESAMGWLPNVFRTAARSPAVLRLLAGQAEAMESVTIEPRHRTAIGLRVARLTDCDYAGAFHAAAARREGRTECEIERCRKGLSDDPREQVLLALASKACNGLGHNTRFVVDVAREIGMDDRQIIEVAALVACQMTINLVCTLAGVETDPLLAGGESTAPVHDMRKGER